MCSIYFDSLSILKNLSTHAILYMYKKNRTTESGTFPTPKCESDLDMLRMCLKGK